MTLDITSYLLSAQSLDGKTRTEAEKGLKQLQEQNASAFLLSLSIELLNEAKPVESRRLASIVLKNSLDAQRWMTHDTIVKSQIKESLLITLASEPQEAWHTSAQVIAKIAAIEIPNKQWPDLIHVLLYNVTLSNCLVSLKQATLETLGYVCGEISHEDLEQTEVNAVLKAVAQAMNLAQNTPEIRLAATKALYNALAFAQTSFDNVPERNYIIEVVCDTVTCKEIEIRRAANECLVAIASMYYEVLEPYMQALYELTSKAVKGDQEPVALQAIEFWSSICDEEIEIQESYGEDIDQSEASHSHFIQKALPYLVPILLETLLKQEEDQDQDDSNWNLSMAGGTCLGLVARTVGDSIVPLVMPFVEDNISSQEWRCREAATFAFGSILDGPKMQTLSPLVQSVLKFLLKATKDENNHVRDRTAWTLSRIFELLHSPASGFSVITAGNIQPVLGVLVESLKDSPNVAEKICRAIYYLAQGFVRFEDVESSSTDLTPYIRGIIAALINTANRTDATDDNLRSAVYETLNETVRCAKMPASAQSIEQLLDVMLAKLSLSFDLPIGKERQGDLQALLCGVLPVIFQKLNTDETKHTIISSADIIMILILKILASRSALVHEEAMLVVGALTYPTGAEFARYMPDFYVYLEMGLRNVEDYQVCSITVGVIVNICRALKDKMFPYCDGIITFLLKGLANGELHRYVKPPIFSCIGEIALAIGAQFEKYLAYAIPMMQSASEFCGKMDTNDDEKMEFANLLRCSIFEAYSGILRGFREAKSELLVPHAEHLLQSIEFVFRDKEREEGVTKAAIAVLGDLADSLGSNTKLLLNDSSFYIEFIQECLNSDDPQLKTTAIWTQGTIGRIMASS